MRLSALLLALFFSLGHRILLADEVQGLVIPFKQVSVSSPIQDIIMQVAVEEGDVVKEGQLLVKLASDKEELDVQQYQKLIERREFEARGAETLFKEKMASKETMLEKQTELDLARLQSRLAVAKLNEKTIKAPLAGIVVKKYKESGEAVDRVEKLIDIVNIDKVYIQVYLDPKLMPVIKADGKVPVRFPVLDGSVDHVATVSFIDPRIDAASGLFRVKLLLNNADHQIKAGMRAQADFSKLVLANK